MSGTCLIGITIMGICAGISDVPPSQSLTAIDASCDYRRIDMPPSVEAEYLDENGRLRADLPADKRRFALTIVGNNRIRASRCDGGDQPQ